MFIPERCSTELPHTDVQVTPHQHKRDGAGRFLAMPLSISSILIACLLALIFSALGKSPQRKHSPRPSPMPSPRSSPPSPSQPACPTGETAKLPRWQYLTNFDSMLIRAGLPTAHFSDYPHGHQAMADPVRRGAPDVPVQGWWRQQHKFHNCLQRRRCQPLHIAHRHCPQCWYALLCPVSPWRPNLAALEHLGGSRDRS